MKNKSKRRQRIFALLACLFLVCSMFVISSSAADRIRSEDDVTLDNLSGTTWVFSSTVSSPYPSAPAFSATIQVSYDRNSTSYSTFGFGSSSVVGGTGGFGSSDLPAGMNYYYSSGWVNESVEYRTYTFTSNIISVTPASGYHAFTAQVFLDWLKANAELQVEPDPTQDLMDGVGDSLSEILTDVGDVANSIVSNPVLLVMCIGLPIISVVCGFLARLKNRT